MKPHRRPGRVICVWPCGSVSPCRGFIVSDHLDRQAQFYNDMGIWMSAGKIKWQETIVAGIENAPKAFIGLFKGDNVGKMLVRL